MDGFFEALSDNIKSTFTELIDKELNQTDLIESALDDSDIKLSLYRSFKSLYDKWISSSDSGDNVGSGYFFNNYGQKGIDKADNRTLFEHFDFVNRTGADIGGKAVIDVSYLSNLSNTKNGQGPTQTLYQSITNLLSKNNFDFFALPSFISYSERNKQDLVDMFKAFSGPLNPIPSSPKFVCMFIGGSSRSLDIPRSSCGTNGTEFDYTDDSFDINEPTTYPQDFLENGGITAFKVRFGQETQNHFSSINLDQAEFKETQESLLVIDALTNPETGSSPSQIGKGNNIFDVYLTRSYSCEVTALGNINIQPLMFFKLENVPMFRGTYLIIDVKHEIKPHNVVTKFKGVRQPIVTVPLVTDALSILDLTLSNVAIDGETTSLSDTNYTSWGTQGGETITLNFSSPEYDQKLYGDNSAKVCPTDERISDGGVGDAYIKGKKYKIRLCKVKDADGGSGKVNVEMALNVSNMMKKAESEGIPLTIGSSFRTMEGQISAAKNNGCFKSGSYKRSDCKVATATPGHSNHQSGTAIDFGCGGKTICYPNSSEWCAKNGSTRKPEQFKCFKFMVENANNYSYYNYPKEAWHWSATGG